MPDADGPPAVHTVPGPAPVGRREANKIATRQALQRAADRLFAERGVALTTVRDIADEAGVTERTFFRYFGSKEDLIIRDAFDWIPVLQQVILDRPAAEPPLVAVRRALETLIGSITRSDTASPLTLFAGGPPGERVSPSALRIMRKVETDVADVLEQRLRAARRRKHRDIDPRFEAEVLARTAAAAFRSAMLRDAELRRDGDPDRPALLELLGQAFDALT
jgi:AcrR family transcriptional regulator